MHRTLFQRLQHGQQYAKTWPLKPELASIFIDYQVIRATSLAVKVTPVLAAFTLCIQLSALGGIYTPQAIACSLFVLSLPLQGWLWLAYRADTLLPLSIANWYQRIYEKMAQQGAELPQLAAKPRYQELAILLKYAYDKHDSSITKNFF